MSDTAASVVSSPRYDGFDLARGLAVLVMVCIHVLHHVGGKFIQDTDFALTFNGLSSLLTAPVFIFLMGVNRVFSRNSSLNYHLRRGVVLILLGYGLNLLRGVLPVFVGMQMGWVTPPEDPLPHLWEIDVLVFAGLAYILLSLLITATRSALWPAALTLGLCGIYSALPLISVPEVGWRYLVNLLFASEPYAYFPLFPWIIYALAGMAYGLVLQKAADKDRFFFLTAMMGVGALAGGGYILLNHGGFSLELWLTGVFQDGGDISGLYVFTVSGWILLWLAICQWLSPRLISTALGGVMRYWSREVTLAYCVQWILVGWYILFFTEEDIPATVLAMVVLSVGTHHGIALVRKGLDLLKSKPATPVKA